MADYRFHRAKLIRVVDGDTCDLLIDVGFNIHAKERFRLAGINCPEMGTPEGASAKLFAEGWFTRNAGECSLICHGKDKYGRWVATIESIGDKNFTLNGALLANSYAVPYEG